ncbi:MAG: L-ribulose-5-phosphate 4-epimerase AraD [Christensenellaceae bacterium]|jgi:L-ribulose-5-phosphate 4-epimerase|nr:L-ribulose-5-phosphate 4-epimerase AraD [Christensenellaceae bacterium]
MNRNELKERVLAANLEIKRSGLAILTWGNASMRDAASGEIAIKPSGVAYEALRAEDIVVLGPEGQIIEGALRPSSDTDTHLCLYRAFPGVNGVVHAHSPYAVAFAQAGLAIPCLGTTHADSFYGEIPCTRALSEEEIAGRYEWETGKVIAEAFAGRSPLHTPGVLVSGHGPFAFGGDAESAAQSAVILEEVAKMALLTLQLRPGGAGAEKALMDKHFFRKHGENASYGQKKGAPR